MSSLYHKDLDNSYRRSCSDRISSDDTVFPLSEDQVANFSAWHRPHELFGPLSAHQDDNLMTQSTRLDLVQDITTDCSVVASLSAAAKIWTGKHAVSECTLHAAISINILYLGPLYHHASI